MPTQKGNYLTPPGFRRIETRMHRRHVGSAALAFLLGVLLSSLSFLAYASPPDPLWVRGISDDADFDDVVCLILAHTELVDDAASVKGRPAFVPLAAEVSRDDLALAPFPLRSSPPRAPPHPLVCPLRSSHRFGV